MWDGIQVRGYFDKPQPEKQDVASFQGRVWLNDCTIEDRELVGHLLCSAANVAREKGVSQTGYRTVMNWPCSSHSATNYRPKYSLQNGSLPWQMGLTACAKICARQNNCWTAPAGN